MCGDTKSIEPKGVAMSGVTILLAATAIGVDYGWQPTDDGDLEYIIQIEPSLLEALREGDELKNAIPRQIQGVTRFRIVVGNQTLPRVGELPRQPEPPVEPEEPRGDGQFQPLPDHDSFLPDLGGDLLVPPPATEEKPEVDPPPAVLNLDPDSKEIQPAAFVEADPPTESAIPTNSPTEANAGAETGATKPRPWMPLLLTALILFASIGLNVYLVWIARGLYLRYRTAVADLRQHGAVTA